MSSITEAPWLLVAAIDFGTTFSGYAFSFKTSPENITMNKNWGGNVGFAVSNQVLNVLIFIATIELVFATSTIPLRKGCQIGT